MIGNLTVQDILTLLVALGVFVSGPLVLLVRAVRENTRETVAASDANVASRETETAKITDALPATPPAPAARRPK